MNKDQKLQFETEEHKLSSDEFSLIDDHVDESHYLSPHKQSSYLEQTSEATCFKMCLSTAGNFCRMIQCCCASCGCGPIQIINEGEVGLRLDFGKLSNILKPGIHSFNPCTQKIIKVNIKSQIIQIDQLVLLTSDSVTLFIDVYVNYSVVDPVRATFMVSDYSRMITFFTQGVMKNCISTNSLTDFLQNRQKIESKLVKLIDAQTVKYGLKVYSIETMRVQLPQSMDRVMAITAESQRQATAKIIEARGDLTSAPIFKQSADELEKNHLSIQLHYFDTLKTIAGANNSTLVVPDSILNSLMNRSSR